MRKVITHPRDLPPRDVRLRGHHGQDANGWLRSPPGCPRAAGDLDGSQCDGLSQHPLADVGLQVIGRNQIHPSPAQNAFEILQQSTEADQPDSGGEIYEEIHIAPDTIVASATLPNTRTCETCESSLIPSSVSATSTPAAIRRAAP